MAKTRHKNPTDKTDETITFEKALKELEARTVKLEQEGVTLEDALKNYEEGVQYARICAKLLEDAENRIKQLSVDRNGNVVMEHEDIQNIYEE